MEVYLVDREKSGSAGRVYPKAWQTVLARPGETVESACGKRTVMAFVVNLTGVLESADGELRSHLGATEGEDSSAWQSSG